MGFSPEPTSTMHSPLPGGTPVGRGGSGCVQGRTNLKKDGTARVDRGHQTAPQQQLGKSRILTKMDFGPKFIFGRRFNWEGGLGWVWSGVGICSGAGVWAFLRHPRVSHTHLCREGPLLGRGEWLRVRTHKLEARRRSTCDAPPRHSWGFIFD